jgi:hypothetical protein
VLTQEVAAVDVRRCRLKSSTLGDLFAIVLQAVKGGWIFFKKVNLSRAPTQGFQAIATGAGIEIGDARL